MWVPFLQSSTIGKAKKDDATVSNKVVSGTGKRQEGTSLGAENILSVYVCTYVRISRCTFKVCIFYWMCVIL